MQGIAGEAQQFVDPRTGPSQSPTGVQVSPQNQVFRVNFRQNDFRPMPSEQGMIPIGTQGGNAMQPSDRYSGTRTAKNVAQQPRGAAALKELIGHRNYLQTSP